MIHHMDDGCPPETRRYREAWRASTRAGRERMLAEEPQHHTEALQLSIDAEDDAMVEHLLVWEGSTAEPTGRMYNRANRITRRTMCLLLEDGRAPPPLTNMILTRAAQVGCAEVVDYLQRAGVRCPRSDAHSAFRGGLRESCARGHTEVVRLLLEDGAADPAQYDSSALRIACSRGHADVVRLLLADGRASPRAGRVSAEALARHFLKNTRDPRYQAIARLVLGGPDTPQDQKSETPTA